MGRDVNDDSIMTGRTLATLEHRTSPKRPYSFWEYDPARRLLIATVRLGHRKPADLQDVILCVQDRPRRFAWSVSEVSPDSFLVHPTQYVGGRWVPTSFHVGWQTGFLMLTGAPKDVAQDLRDL